MTVADLNENLFQQFMSKNPVWEFHCISRDEYLHRSKADKEQLVLQYYNKVKMGEQITFNIFYFLLRFLLRCLFVFLNCSSPNLPSSLSGVWYICSIASRIIFDWKCLTSRLSSDINSLILYFVIYLFIFLVLFL